jgi:hypothetical protein
MLNFKSYSDLAEIASSDCLQDIEQCVRENLNDLIEDCTVLNENERKQIEFFIPVESEEGKEQNLRLNLTCKWKEEGFVCEIKNINLFEKKEYEQLMLDVIYNDLESLRLNQEVRIRVRNA